MARLTLRAVEQPDGRYRISITPDAPEVDRYRVYTAGEVRELAERIHADVRWVSSGGETTAEPEPLDEEWPSASVQYGSPGSFGESSPAPETSAPSDDPWGGSLPAGKED